MLKKPFLILTAVFFAALIPPVWYLLDLPDTSELLKENPKTSSMRTLREKQLEKKGGKPRSSMEWRSLNLISPHLAHAVVLAEDDTFYQHNGFDIEQLKRAARTNWERKRFAFGASTITQQLARTLYLSSRKNLLRKAKEALITRRLEKTLSKKRILELYLNVVEWGPQVYGAEAASWHFFGKPASDLTPEEAVALAVILPSPRRWSPLGEGRFIMRRKAALYDRMARANYIPAPGPVNAEGAPFHDGEEPPAEEEPLLDDQSDEDLDVAQPMVPPVPEETPVEPVVEETRAVDTP